MQNESLKERQARLEKEQHQKKKTTEKMNLKSKGSKDLLK